MEPLKILAAPAGGDMTTVVVGSLLLAAAVVSATLALRQMRRLPMAGAPRPGALAWLVRKRPPGAADPADPTDFSNPSR